MPAPSNTISSRLASQRLPALDYNLRQIRATLDRPATSHLVLARLVSDDPGLVLALMRRLGGDPRCPTPPPASPLQIIGLLGREVFREILSATPVLESRYREPVLGGLRQAYGRAIHAAAFARRLSTLGGIGGVDEVAAAALLGNLLEMALWVGRPDLASSLGPAGESPWPWFERATEAFETDEPPGPPVLARQWRLPDILCQTLASDPNEDRGVRLTRLSLTLSWAAHWDWYAPRTLALMQELGDLLQLAPDLLQAVLHREAAKTARSLHDLGLPHCMDRLLLPTDAPWRQDRQPAASQAAPSHEAPKPANPLRQGLSKVLTRVRAELGLERAMFAMLTPDRRRLRARFVASEEVRSGLRGFDLPLEGDNLFTRMLKEKKPLSVDPSHLVAHLPEIPPAVASLLPPDGFFAAPVVVKGRVIGILYGDGKDLGGIRTFRMFQALAREAAWILSSSAVGQGQGAGGGPQTAHRPQPRR